MKDGSKRESIKQAERESGTRKDVEGMGKDAHKRHHMPNHEFGSCHEGSEYHESHRGKS